MEDFYLRAYSFVEFLEIPKLLISFGIDPSSGLRNTIKSISANYNRFKLEEPRYFEEISNGNVGFYRYSKNELYWSSVYEGDKLTRSIFKSVKITMSNGVVIESVGGFNFEKINLKDFIPMKNKDSGIIEYFHKNIKSLVITNVDIELIDDFS